MTRKALAPLLVTLGLLAAASTATATPVCTDGYMGGPPASACGNRIFPEAAIARAYIQYTPDPTGFAEYQHGIEYLAQKYPRWISVFKLSDRYGKDAVSSGPDKVRPDEQGDSGDGRDVWVVKITDHNVTDKGKRSLFFSLSVHGNERGGLEGGVRTAEDLAIAATDGGKINDGIDNYTSTTGRKPVFHEYEVRDVLAKQAVYLVDFNLDGWAIGDIWNVPSQPFARTNSMGTDLNRQMPTIGRIDTSRNPLQESEARAGERLMREVAAAGRNGKFEYGADIHGELTSQAYVDVMYPAGQYNSVDHRRLMAIAERTKSVIDETLFGGSVNQVEENTGGNEAEAAQGGLPTKPAHWATVWDTLGYTDTGFIGDYLATDLGVTGMDYEIAFNHSVPDKVWNVYLQENHINATRGIIKTAMAYSLFQEDEFNASNFKLDPKGRPGYVVDPDTVTDTDANGPGTLAGPSKDGKGADGKPVVQNHYEATNQRWFSSTNPMIKTRFVPLAAADVAKGPDALDLVDTLVLADVPAPADAKRRGYDSTAYYAQIKAWVERGGNLVLTDRALHALGPLRILDAAAVEDIKVYQPYADFTDLAHPLAKGLRANARQLVEAAILGNEIGDTASPMTIVDGPSWEAKGGKTVGTTGMSPAGDNPAAPRVSVGEMAIGKGKVRIVGGALPMPTEQNDHRYGLRDFAMTYTGLYIMENAIEHDAPGLGEKPLPVELVGTPGPAGNPKATKCLPGARYVVRVPKRFGTRGVSVRVNGKRVKVRKRGGRLVTTVTLKRFRGRTLAISIRRANKTVATLRYKVCGKKAARKPAKRKKAKRKRS